MAPHSYWSKSSAFANTNQFDNICESVIQAISYAMNSVKSDACFGCRFVMSSGYEEVDNDK